MTSLRVLAVVAALSSGCSHSLLLKKYAATSPAVPALKGRAIYVEPFANEARGEWTKNDEPLPDPPRWEYRELSSKQLDQWDAERRKLGDDLPLAKQFRVGQKRNGFGIPIKDVFSVNSPAEWLTESTRLEVAAQGASLVETPEAADVVVRGVVRSVWLDLYMVTWAHIVLDLTTVARGQAPRSVRLHVADARLAWTGGDTESYELFCAAEQKLQRYVLDAIVRENPAPGGAPASL
jgi:hypothetical protein